MVLGGDRFISHSPCICPYMLIQLRAPCVNGQLLRTTPAFFSVYLIVVSAPSHPSSWCMSRMPRMCCGVVIPHSTTGVGEWRGNLWKGVHRGAHGQLERDRDSNISLINSKF